MDRFVILSGCSGGGKSTLLEELARRGFSTVEEPGRRIVAQEMRRGGMALPWVDMAAFARRAVRLSLEDRQNASSSGTVFFDRGLIDAASVLHDVTGDAFIERLRRDHRYNRLVFLTPPWPEIYRTDGERQHGFDAAITEYERLLRDYARLEYETVVLPRASVGERADLVLGALSNALG
ncbi:AAA family ATPase [Agrobacterium tumefaciens]|uniref:AAA family ATPase n=1 Tax=Agrobacterium tumefaciens TaxID=358 RepID=UPI00287DAA16|nr:AAA family ATPase [Agrobacterium tumefaciens]MDS7597843.1 AAA family ATPase [Agrobacterium tumefaciens]